MSNYRNKKCRECSAEFLGGPRAWYCPRCRKERQQEAERRYKKNVSRGISRKIGSTDFCVVCGKPYIVEGGQQKYCQDCAEREIKRIASQQSLVYYNQNKDTINPKRNLDRKKGVSICAMCGKLFPTQGASKYCGDECRQLAKRFGQAISDAKRYGKTPPTAPPEKRKIIDWSVVDWSRTDKEIAVEIGESYNTVYVARRRLKIPKP